MINNRCVMQLQRIILLWTKISWDLNVYNHEMLHIRTKKPKQTKQIKKNIKNYLSFFTNLGRNQKGMRYFMICGIKKYLKQHCHIF